MTLIDSHDLLDLSPLKVAAAGAEITAEHDRDTDLDPAEPITDHRYPLGAGLGHTYADTHPDQESTR